MNFNKKRKCNEDFYRARKNKELEKKNKELEKKNKELNKEIYNLKNILKKLKEYVELLKNISTEKFLQVYKKYRLNKREIYYSCIIYKFINTERNEDLEPFKKIREEAIRRENQNNENNENNDDNNDNEDNNRIENTARDNWMLKDT